MWRKYLLLFILPSLSFGYIGMNVSDLPYEDALQLFFLFPKIMQKYQFSTINIVLISCIILTILFTMILLLENFDLMFNELGKLYMIRYGTISNFLKSIQIKMIRNSAMIVLTLSVSILFWIWYFIGSLLSIWNILMLLLIIIRLVLIFLIFVEIIVFIQYKLGFDFMHYYLLIFLLTDVLIECVGNFNLVIHFPSTVLQLMIQNVVFVFIFALILTVSLKSRGEHND